MNIRRTNASMTKEENVNQEVPLQTPQNPHVPIEKRVMFSVEIRATLDRFNQVLATQVARNTMVQLNPNANTTASRIGFSQR